MRSAPLNFHGDYAPQRASICPRCHNPIGGDGGGFCSDLCTDLMPLEILADLEIGSLPYGFVGDDEAVPETRLPAQGLSSMNDAWSKARRYLRSIPFPFTVLPEVVDAK